MNVAEILRALADKISSVEQTVPHQDQSAELHPVEVDNVDDTDSNLMVPPLQQKLELMKRWRAKKAMIMVVKNVVVIPVNVMMVMKTRWRS